MILQLVHSLVRMEMKTIGILINSTAAARDQKNNYCDGWGGWQRKEVSQADQGKHMLRPSGLINAGLLFSEIN